MSEQDLPELEPHPRDAEPLTFDDRPQDDLTALIAGRGYSVRDWREANRCRNCGHCQWDPDTGERDIVQTPCDHGCCIVFRCAKCRHFNSGFGAAGCPCDDGI